MKLVEMNYLLLFSLLLILGGCSECEHWEIMEAKYSDWNAVLKADSASKGWIPPILPNSAQSIREIHDLDTNRVWGSAKISNEDALQLSLNRNKNTYIRKLFQDYSYCFIPPFKKNTEVYSFQDSDDDSYFWYYAIDRRIGLIYFMRGRYGSEPDSDRSKLDSSKQ